MSRQLTACLERLAPARSLDETFEPRRFRLDQDEDRGELLQLVLAGEVAFYHDSLRAQLTELLETRHPAERLDIAGAWALAVSHLGGVALEDYGVQVFYPWSRRLVHVLPEAEYRELRTSRNRNKITAVEQERLRALRLGVVGLSVGQATAVTLAIEEIGGHYRLADFDTLSLSNLNRLRAGAHAVGLNKAVLTAREIFEINPFASVKLFPAGLRRDNIDEFLLEDGKLDLLFEECDGLEVKIRVRERARALRIPVLMETSDRGLIDVERFDREPERPLLHGLAGELRSEEIAGLSGEERLPVVLRILGEETISRRMAASLMDLGATLRTWPQLGSAVALGGALNADVARRIALGSMTRSGRFYVDLERLISDETAAATALAGADAATHGATVRTTATTAATPTTMAAAPVLDAGAARTAAQRTLPALSRADPPLAREELRALVACAALAPSAGNGQPLRYVFGRGRLRTELAPGHDGALLDYAGSASHIALGAAMENLDLAARRMGLVAELRPFPEPALPRLLCDVRLRPGGDLTGDDRALLDEIPRRVTNRGRGDGRPLLAEHGRAMSTAATQRGASLRLLLDRTLLGRMGTLLGHAERLRYLSPPLHREHFSALRFSAAEAARTRDGIDVRGLGLGSKDLAALRLARDPSVMETQRAIGGGEGLGRPLADAVASSAALGILSVDNGGPLSAFTCGRALQRLWLAATRAGVGLWPLSTLPQLLLRLERGGGEGLPGKERQEIAALGEDLRGLLGPTLHPGTAVPLPHLLLAFTYAAPPAPATLRRDLDELLTFEDP